MCLCDAIIAELVLSDLQRAPLVKRCVLEAIRLHSPGTIVRHVTESFTLHVVVCAVWFRISLTNFEPCPFYLVSIYYVL